MKKSVNDNSSENLRNSIIVISFGVVLLLMFFILSINNEATMNPDDNSQLASIKTDFLKLIGIKSAFGSFVDTYAYGLECVKSQCVKVRNGGQKLNGCIEEGQIFGCGPVKCKKTADCEVNKDITCCKAGKCSLPPEPKCTNPKGCIGKLYCDSSNKECAESQYCTKGELKKTEFLETNPGSLYYRNLPPEREFYDTFTVTNYRLKIEGTDIIDENNFRRKYVLTSTYGSNIEFVDTSLGGKVKYTKTLVFELDSGYSKVVNFRFIKTPKRGQTKNDLFKIKSNIVKSDLEKYGFKIDKVGDQSVNVIATAISDGCEKGVCVEAEEEFSHQCNGVEFTGFFTQSNGNVKIGYKDIIHYLDQLQPDRHYEVITNPLSDGAMEIKVVSPVTSSGGKVAFLLKSGESQDVDYTVKIIRDGSRVGYITLLATDIGGVTPGRQSIVTREIYVYKENGKCRIAMPDEFNRCGFYQPSSTIENKVVDSTVRIHSYFFIRNNDAKLEKVYITGSGTIIDIQNGYALVVTAKHLFHDQNRPVTVDLLDGEQNIPAEKLFESDWKSDLSFIRFQVPDGYKATSVKLGNKYLIPLMYDLIFSVGCAGGGACTIQKGYYTGLLHTNFLDGEKDLFTTSCMPTPGRSGGGLYNRYGELIGVINAGDFLLDAGLYTPLTILYLELAKIKDSWWKMHGLRPDKDPIYP